MAKKRKLKNKYREHKSLKAPFTKKKLEKFMREIPDHARIRVVTVSSPPMVSIPSVSYLEAFWKPSLETFE